MLKYPIVKVVWFDASVDNAWTGAQELADGEAEEPCVTVGFLVKKPTKKNPVYMVAATRSHQTDHEEIEFVAIQSIPKAWVKSLEKLENE